MAKTSLPQSYPSDWPDNLTEIKEIDKLLRCPICHDYMTTAMIAPDCSHTYCSVCIRRYIGYKNQCPTCTEPVSEPNLRNNRILDDLIRNFTSVRSRLLRVVSGLQDITVKEEPDVSVTAPVFSSCILPVKAEPSTTAQFPMFETPKKSPVLPSLRNQRQKQTQSDSHAIIVDSDSDNDFADPPFQPPSELRVFSPPPPSLTFPRTPLGSGHNKARGFSARSPGFGSPSADVKKVPCPVCAVEIPERNINLHLDQCLAGSEKKEALRSRPPPRRKPMPKLVYNLMKDRELKKKLTELGLPTTGDRQALIKRHSEFTLQYNAQCDSLQPKSASEITKEIVESDKTKLLLGSPSRLQIEKGATPLAVEKAQKSYVQKHKSQFKELIADVRQRMKKAKGKSSTSETTEEGTRETETTGASTGATANESESRLTESLDVQKALPILNSEVQILPSKDTETEQLTCAVKTEPEDLDGSLEPKRSSDPAENSSDAFQTNIARPSQASSVVSSVANHQPPVRVETALSINPHLLKTRNISTDSPAGSEMGEEEDCYSPNLYSDGDSLPLSCTSTIAYSVTAEATTVAHDDSNHGDQDPDIQPGQQESYETTPSYEENDATGFTPEFGISSDQLSEECPAASSSALTLSSRKRKRVLANSTDTKPVTEIDPCVKQEPLSDTSNTVTVETAPRKRRKKKEVLVDMDALYEAYSDDGTKPRMTRSRAKTRTNNA